MNGGTLSATTPVAIFNGGSAVGTFSSITFNGSNVIDTAGTAITLSAQLNGAGTVTRNGAGTLTLGVGNNTNFSNSFFGGTFINTAGTLDFSSRLAGSGSASWIINGGTVTVSETSGGSVAYGLLQGLDPTIPITVLGTNLKLSIGSLGGVSTYAGAITSAGTSFGIAKVGTGTLILSGQNTPNLTDGLTFTGLSGGYPRLLSAVAGTFGRVIQQRNGAISGPLGGTPTYDPTVGSLTAGAAALIGGNATLTSAALVTGGAFTVANDITVSGGGSFATAQAPGSYVFTLGGVTDNTSTFSGKVTLQNNLTVSQTPTTGSHALNLTGGIYGMTGGFGVNNGTFIALENTGFQTGDDVYWWRLDHCNRRDCRYRSEPHQLISPRLWLWIWWSGFRHFHRRHGHADRRQQLFRRDHGRRWNADPRQERTSPSGSPAAVSRS